MLYQINDYIKFLVNSTNHHGVHSPFVYDFVTRCLYDKSIYPAYGKFEEFRKRLLADQEIIEVTDFGAGSRVFSSSRRKVSDIAKHAGITAKRQQLLYRVVQYFQPKHLLELGTSLGLGTAALSMGNTKAQIISVEGCPQTARKASAAFQHFQLQHIDLKAMRFEDYFKMPPPAPWDLVYIDGHHNKDRTLYYFDQLLKHIHNDTLLIFDDIHWSKEMNEAWIEIAQHPKVTVSIDTFFWGLVFFRIEQPKQHFVIRL